MSLQLEVDREICPSFSMGLALAVLSVALAEVAVEAAAVRAETSEAEARLRERLP